MARFIDLFAGLGGFHSALSNLGHECVLVSEIQDDLRELYKRNHPEIPEKYVIGDIHTEIDVKDIPDFDILCAGFPCQPFSQAGKRQGLNDPKNGNHFEKIIEIIKAQKNKPGYVILENVPNLYGHDGGKTWDIIQGKLKKLNYKVKERIYSPDQFGIPQHRKRIYIVAVDANNPVNLDQSFPDHLIGNIVPNAAKAIVHGSREEVILRPDTKAHIRHWQKFLDILKTNNIPVPRFPIWAIEFGATYPFDKVASSYSLKDLRQFRGGFGCQIKAKSKNELKDYIPKYALNSKEDLFPKWKVSYIEKSRTFYARNEDLLHEWVKELQEQHWKLSHQKFEWNCGPDANSELKDKIIQFRPSGVRVKNLDRFPALVLTATQIPIVYDKKNKDFRYLTKREAANLQSFPQDFIFPETNAAAFRSFGNAVNVQVIKLITKSIIKNNG